CSGADKCDAHEDGSDSAPDQGKRVWRPKSENRPGDGLPVRYVRHDSTPSFRDVDLNQRARSPTLQFLDRSPGHYAPLSATEPGNMFGCPRGRLLLSDS